MSIQYATPPQRAKIFALLKELGQSEYRPSIISAFTDNRTSSITELWMFEARGLIRHLDKQLPKEKQAYKPQKAFTAEDKADYALKCKHMREKLIALAHGLDWKLASGKLDIDHLNAWLKKNSHKELNSMSAKELQAAVTQLELATNNS